MKRIPWVLGAAAAIGASTWVVGWWTVPVLGAAFGWVRRRDPAAPMLAGLAALIGWAVLLAISASGAPRGSVMQAVGSAMQVGPGALLALTLAYPALLAASAAGVVRAVVGRD